MIRRVNEEGQWVVFFDGRYFSGIGQRVKGQKVQWFGSSSKEDSLLIFKIFSIKGQEEKFEKVVSEVVFQKVSQIFIRVRKRNKCLEKYRRIC